MSEEEKDAIEYLKENALVRIDNNGNIIATGNSYKLIILNYIDKLQKENEELKERVNVFDKAIKCDKCNCNICEAEKIILKLQKENKKIRDTNKKLYEMGQQNAIQEILNEKWVSKDKIRDKIKELEGQEDWYIENKNLDELYGMIDILNELLEEE